MPREIIQPTAEEDAAISHAARSDPDALPLVDGDIASGRLRRVRGPQKLPTKEQVTVRLDPDVLEKLRAQGRGWQGRMNALLRQSLGL